jgi:hypothetical protein
MFEILILLAKSVPVVAILWLVIDYLVKEKKSYVKKIDELQDELRKNERQSLEVMNRLTGVLDKLLENSAEDKHEILKEIAALHKDIAKKLNDIKKS